MKSSVASQTKARSPFMRVLPVALKVIALCVISLVALLLLLPPPPERSDGGVTSVAKHIPHLRDTVNPLGKRPDEATNRNQPVVVTSREPQQAEGPRPVVITAPPDTADEPPMPLRKPENDGVTDVAPPGESTSQPSIDTSEIARLRDEPERAGPIISGADAPSGSDIQDWLRSQAWEFLGGVDPQGNILYRFEVWLDAPRDVLNGIKSVSYLYDAPSATPGERESDDAKSGFRARFGSLSCSKNVTVVVTMADGSSQQAIADGCRALN